MSKLCFADTALVDGVREREDGYLVTNARVGRVGVQAYRGYEVGRPDLKDVAVYRPPEQVFAIDAVQSLSNKPVTLLHPPESVKSTNWSKYAKGYSGDDVMRDGQYLRIPLMLADQAAIDAFKKHGIKELSIGYSTDLDWTPGVTEDGQSFDCRQTNIRANHIALVPTARGGSNLTFGDGGKVCPQCGARMSVKDSKYVCDCGMEMPMNDDDPDYMDDAAFSAEERRDLAKKGLAKPDGSYPIRNRSDLQHAIEAWGRGGSTRSDKDWIIKRAKALGAEADLPDDWKPSSTKDGFGRRLTTKGRTMTHTVLVDGSPIEVADELSKSVIERAMKVLRDAAEEAKAAKAKSDVEKAEEERKRTIGETDAKKAMDAKDGEIAALKQQLGDAAMTPAKLNALVVERAAVTDAAAKVIGSDKGLADMSNADIKRTAVVAKLSDAWKDAKAFSDDSVDGAFKALAAVPGTGAGVRKLADSIGFIQTSHSVNLDDARAERDKAYNQRVADIAWKPKNIAAS